MQPPDKRVMPMPLSVRLRLAAAAACLALTGCAGPGTIGGGGAVARGPGIYRIDAGDEGRIQFAMLDAVNALRTARAAPALQLDPSLNAAAATHSRDMANQNRPWHFGSDGSSPIDRITRAGYAGSLGGEAISESFEGEIATLTAWMEEPATRDVILDPAARDMGFAWYQEPSGKLWWTLVTGRPEVPLVRATPSAPALGF